jgi:carotenoid cleavage dioxygenase-like enzyme
VYRNRSTDDPSVQKLNRTVANTAMYTHAGKLFALKEDARPYLIDPNTLETQGEHDFGGKYKSQTFTAHPKTDPTTGEMICYGYEAAGDLTNDVFVYWVDKGGNVTREVRFKAPVISMMHDIALTQKHIVFNTTGFTTSPEQLKAGKVHWAWDSKVPTYVGILPRDGDEKDVRWFKGPERAAIHIFNGKTEGNKVTIETPASNGNPFPFFPQTDGSPWSPQKAHTVIRRWTFDLGSKKDSWQEEILFPQASGQLGRIDDRYISLPNRYAFMGYSDPSKPVNTARVGNMRGMLTNCIGRFDFATGKLNTYFVGDVCGLQEVQFIARSKKAEEGDGWLVAIASNYAEMRSELVVVDSLRLEEGDVARVKLPFRVNSQVHGWWAGTDDLPLTEPV